MKLGAKSAPAPAEEPTDAAPAEEPTDTNQDTGDDLDFSTGSGDQSDDQGQDTGADDTSADTGDKGSSDKPFDDEPFDAGVEADEEEDPKKYIEQLTGKLGQSLRKYEDDKGEPDFELEKFAINSLLSATHTGEMEPEDQKDIIKKVKKAGKGDDNAEPEDTGDDQSTGDETGSEDTGDTGTEDTTSDETGGDESSTEAPADDSENMFETEMLDEMSLNDHMAKQLIKLFDDGDKGIKAKICRLVCGADTVVKKPVVRLSVGDILSSGAKVDSKPFVTANTPSGKIKVNIIYPDKDSAVTATWGKSTIVGVVEPDRERFIKELHEDIDKEHIEYIFEKLRQDGINTEVNVDTEENLEESFDNAFILQNPPKNNMFQEGSNDILDEKNDRCTRIAKRIYDTWPSAYASGAVVKCRKGKIWKNVDENYLDEMDALEEKWSEKYKRSIDCNNPKGFSQKAHCQGKKKKK